MSEAEVGRQPMQYGRCPICRKLRICAKVWQTDSSGLFTLRYYIRKHKCGRRLSPVEGSLRELRSSPECGSVK